MYLHCSEHEASEGKSGKSAITGGKLVTFALPIFTILEKYPIWIYIAVSMRQVAERVVKVQLLAAKL